MVQHYCRGATILTKNIDINTKKDSNSDGMCEGGSSVVIMLDHRSTAVFIGRRLLASVPVSVCLSFNTLMAEPFVF